MRKHYPESKHPLRIYCVLCGYKKKDGKYARKKNRAITRNATNLCEKIALSCTILKVIQENDNIPV